MNREKASPEAKTWTERQSRIYLGPTWRNIQPSLPGLARFFNLPSTGVLGYFQPSAFGGLALSPLRYPRISCRGWWEQRTSCGLSVKLPPTLPTHRG
jgi:hypothetical protein